MSNPDEDPAGTAHGSVAGIRSRIAAFENISGGITASNPANGAPIKPTGPSAASNGKSGLRRSAMVPSQSDPLTSLPSHASSDAVPSQALLRATSSQNTLVQGRSNSSSLPSSSAINMSKKAEAVPHVGLGSRASPLLAANMLTSEPASVNLDEPDQLITSPTSVKSLQQHIMLAPTHSPNSSPTSSPARTPSEEKTSPVFGSWSSGQKSAAHLPLRNASTSIAGSSDSTAPPIPISTKPRPSPLPSLSISASPSPKFNFVQTQVYVQPPSPLHSGADTSTRTRTPSLSSGTSKPIPVLPPRKVGSSPSISTNGMGSPQIAGGVRGGARVPSGQDSAPSPASAMPSSMKSSKTQIGHPSSISTNHQSPISVLPSPISGSKPRSTILNAPVLPPRPASTTPTSVTSSGSSGRSNTTGLRSPENNSFPPKSGLTGSNGRVPSYRTPSSSVPTRYTDLWEKLLSVLKPGRDESGEIRLDAVVVREVWKKSRLSDTVLGRIWNQCDLRKQGKLNKTEFCKGMQNIDDELRRRKIP